MAAGDIHNSTGTICKAKSDASCPLSTDGGHSKDIDSYVEYQVETSGVDGDAVRAMIADGTPPADAVEVAKAGHRSVANSESSAGKGPYWTPRGNEVKPFTQLDPEVIRHSEELAETAGVNAAWIYLRQNGLKSNGVVKTSHLGRIIERTEGFHPEPKYPFSPENVAALAAGENALSNAKAERA